MSDKPLIVIEEFAAKLGITPEQVRDFIKEGSLPADRFISQLQRDALDIVEQLGGDDGSRTREFKKHITALGRRIMEVPNDAAP